MTFQVATSFLGTSTVNETKLVIETIVKSATISNGVIKVSEPVAGPDLSEFVRLVVDDKDNLTLQDGKGSVVTSI